VCVDTSGAVGLTTGAGLVVWGFYDTVSLFSQK